MGKYYPNIDGRQTYIAGEGEVKPSASSFDNTLGLRWIDIDNGIAYTPVDGNWIVDPTWNPSSVVKTNKDVLNLADIIDSVYDGDFIVSENIEIREFKRGNNFASSYVWSNVASDASVNLHVFTGANPIYTVYAVNGTALTDYGVLFGATVTNNGTSLPILHRNQVNSFTPLTTVYRDATYTGGTILLPRFLGQTGNVLSRAGGGSTASSALLTPNSHYVFKITNSDSAAQARMGIIYEWFEVDYSY
ncbi:MAG: hypothetical protein BV457_07790 [Thermoplasmata archaeon M9B1D]|nr:MAG: hypothetical protein BV457_07790 [Thermoplasmata archaeon M9B1D]